QLKHILDPYLFTAAVAVFARSYGNVHPEQSEYIDPVRVQRRFLRWQHQLYCCMRNSNSRTPAGAVRLQQEQAGVLLDARSPAEASSPWERAPATPELASCSRNDANFSISIAQPLANTPKMIAIFSINSLSTPVISELVCGLWKKILAVLPSFEEPYPGFGLSTIRDSLALNSAWIRFLFASTIALFSGTRTCQDLIGRRYPIWSKYSKKRIQQCKVDKPNRSPSTRYWNKEEKPITPKKVATSRDVLRRVVDDSSTTTSGSSSGSSTVISWLYWNEKPFSCDLCTKANRTPTMSIVSGGFLLSHVPHWDWEIQFGGEGRTLYFTPKLLSLCSTTSLDFPEVFLNRNVNLYYCRFNLYMIICRYFRGNAARSKAWGVLCSTKLAKHVLWWNKSKKIDN
ncbi:unnamed protein product, partial [Acanthoscelides obtectus]